MLQTVGSFLDTGLLSCLGLRKIPRLPVGLCPTDIFGALFCSFLWTMPVDGACFVGEGDFLEDDCLLGKPPDIVLDRGIGTGDVDGSERGGSPGEELVRLLIGISIGSDSADDGERLGLWNNCGCMFGEVGGVGDVE